MYFYELIKAQQRAQRIKVLMGELEKIQERYDRRKSMTYSIKPAVIYYENKIRTERETLIASLIQNDFEKTDSLRLLEIGAGTGGNVPFYKSMGFADDQIYLNELLQDRFDILTESYSMMNLIQGDALKINEEQKFDLIFQFTVFTSVLDKEFRIQLAVKMLRLLNQGGSIIWYDFIFNNPLNQDVKRVSKKELLQLFPDCTVKIFHVTLAPPIGRRIGKLYDVVYKLFPFLRTHMVAVIRKI